MAAALRSTGERAAGRGDSGSSVNAGSGELMQFQSEGFIFLFLPIAIIFSFFKAPVIRITSLVGLSLLFYGAADPMFVLLLLLTTIVSFFTAIFIEDSAGENVRRAALSAAIVVNLAILGYFKYIFFVSDSISSFGSLFGVNVSLERFAPSSFVDYILPAGISFYTFQALSYVIDVYRKDIAAERSFMVCLGFVSFWPHLVAGPIVRYSILGPQIRDYQYDRLPKRYWVAGLDRFAVGLIQKIVLAEGCGTIVNQISLNVSQPDFVTSWMIAVGFGMQIFFDFAAYTNMAIGVAAIFGIRISENFFSPYRADSIQDFWRRWHVTLSIWFRDYVYIPLGGSRRGFAIQLRNVFIVFLITGFWHGAGWNFVAWGLMHGMMLIAYMSFKHFFPNATIPQVLAVAMTFVLVHFAWIPFRFTDIGVINGIWSGMVGANGFHYPATLNPWDVVFVLFVTFLSIALPNSSERWPGRSGLIESLVIWIAAAAALIFAPEVTNFIYFQF
jgi:alginate O-acetyltransferase complex protein AlgI